MLTRLVALMTENLPMATMYFLSPILSHGALANSQPCHTQVQNQNITPWPPLLLNFYGFNLSYGNLASSFLAHLFFGVTTLEPPTSLQILPFMPVQNTSKLTSTLFETVLLLDVLMYGIAPLRIKLLTSSLNC